MNQGEKTKTNHTVSSYKLQSISSSTSKLHLLIISPNCTNKINTKNLTNHNFNIEKNK